MKYVFSLIVAAAIAAGGIFVYRHCSTSRMQLVHSNQYRIVYDLGGGIAGAVYDNLAQSEQWLALAAPARVGYAFAGWTVEGELNVDSALASVVVGTAIRIESSSQAVGAGYPYCGFSRLASPGSEVVLKAHWRRK